MKHFLTYKKINILVHTVLIALNNLRQENTQLKQQIQQKEEEQQQQRVKYMEELQKINKEKEREIWELKRLGGDVQKV